VPNNSEQPSLRQLTDDELSRRWRDESLRYSSSINDFVRRGLRDGWENVDGKEPQDTRQSMAQAVLNAVRRANRVERGGH
jgi:hypothetical protein